MDMYDKKRGMVSELLDMLRRHASEEVESGLKKPEGEGDMAGLEIEKVEVLPDHEMDEPTPEHEIDTKMVPEDEASVLDTEEMPEPKLEVEIEAEDGEDESDGSFFSSLRKRKK